MLTAVPKSFFSGNFEISDSAEGRSELCFHTFGEEGEILHGSREYAVRKHGWLSGRWTLELKGRVVGEASKPSAFSSRFQVELEGLHFDLQRAFLSSAYEIVQRDKVTGWIERAGWFTRRVQIDCQSPLPELAQLFAFWLVGMMWRRDQNASA